MTYVPKTPDEWRSEAGVFSRALRGLADRWDHALTSGASRDALVSIADEVGDVQAEMDVAFDQMPATEGGGEYHGPRGGEAEAEQRHSQDHIQRELKR